MTMHRTVPVLAIACALFLCVPACGAAPAKAAGADVRPVTFLVEIDGMESMGFTSVTGLGVEVEVVEYRDGTSGDVRKIPGRTTYANITLKRGFVSGSELFDWIQSGRTGTIARRSVRVRMLEGGTSRAIQTWDLHDAWPSGWRLLFGEDRTQVVEEVTLVVEWFEEA